MQMGMGMGGGQMGFDAQGVQQERVARPGACAGARGGGGGITTRDCACLYRHHGGTAMGDAERKLLEITSVPARRSHWLQTWCAKQLLRKKSSPRHRSESEVKGIFLSVPC